MILTANFEDESGIELNVRQMICMGPESGFLYVSICFKLFQPSWNLQQYNPLLYISQVSSLHFDVMANLELI